MSSSVMVMVIQGDAACAATSPPLLLFVCLINGYVTNYIGYGVRNTSHGGR